MIASFAGYFIVMNMLSKSVIDDCVEFVLLNEGGYSNDIYDKGGETYYGVTRGFALENGIAWPPTRRQARLGYIDVGKRHGVFYLDHATAKYVLDGCVLFGFRRFISWFQRAISAVCGTSIKCDGVIGPQTVGAYDSCDKARVISVLHEMSRNHHVSVAMRDVKQRRFLRGWLLRADRRYAEFLRLLKGATNG